MKTLTAHEKQLQLLDDFCKNNRDDTNTAKIITLDIALASGFPVYSKASNISKTYKNISHISTALDMGHAIKLDSNYIKFTIDVYIFNVLHDKITLFKQDSTLRISQI